MGIVNTQSVKFYPDNYLRHYDFVIFFINALLLDTNQSLPTTAYSSHFADVDVSAPYFRQLMYASDHGLIDPMIVSKAGQLYFDPDDFLTKHEVYQILAKSTPVQFIYEVSQANQEKITRAELATLLVESFQFTPKQITQSDQLS